MLRKEPHYQRRTKLRLFFRSLWLKNAATMYHDVIADLSYFGPLAAFLFFLAPSSLLPPGLARFSAFNASQSVLDLAICAPWVQLLLLQLLPAFVCLLWCEVSGPSTSIALVARRCVRLLHGAGQRLVCCRRAHVWSQQGESATDVLFG